MKPVPLFIRVSPALRLALKLRAVREDVSVQALVERLLRKSLGMSPPGKEK